MADLTPQAFAEKWAKSKLSECSSYQHFLDLCGMLGQSTPDDVDPEVGKQKKLHLLGHTDDPEGTLAEKRVTQELRSEGRTVSANWGGTVTVVLHRVPESEEYEGGYEAVTMMGVPHGVAITGSDPISAEGALGHLLDGLKAFGFVGGVAVEDTTHIGGVQRYELAVD